METVAMKREQKKLRWFADFYKKLNKEKEREIIWTLLEKVNERRVSIAMCGHFSAGKSSFINEVFGKDVLPTSPIPTSGNIVCVKRGSEGIILHLNDYQEVYCPARTPIEEIKAFCTQGDLVKKIEYCTEEETFPKELMLIDTPGVDSVDEAHALATQSVLHAVDVIFYMMDYNHVSSESNLIFLKELSERQKKVYIIINQIDKHNEEELTFKSFHEKIIETFQLEGITYEHLYFCSLREKEHPYNELKQIKELMGRIVKQAATYVEESIQQELTYLLHRAFPIEDVEEDTEILEQKNELHHEQARLAKKVEEAREAFKQKIKKISQNAYVMTPELRELIALFLESRQKDFKVGFLFSRDKTEKERQKRLEQVWTKLKDEIHVKIVHHFMVEIEQLYKAYHQSSKQQQIGNKIDEGVLFHVLKQEGNLTAQYQLKYCEEVSEEIKRQLVDEAIEQVTHLFAKEEEKNQKSINEIEKELIGLEEIYFQQEMKKEYKEEQKRKYLQGISALEREDVEHVEHTERSRIQKEQLTYEEWTKGLIQEEKPFHQQTIMKQSTIRNGYIADVKELLNLVRKEERLKDLATRLDEKVRNLDENQYMLTLFGAFSAGKSSFANALLGKKILPSSPNPLTATVIKIKRSERGKESGTVDIIYKDEKFLLHEWSSLVGKELHNLEDIRSINSKSIIHEQDRHYVKRIQQVAKKMIGFVGRIEQATIESFQPYVADENIACFVKEAIVYYDCPLTLEHVVLVDTPGADSVYARHTNVTFQFMKESDGILFVTYYNHAFSKSDRELLIQLGKMKELSMLNSMYFIINAIDLSKNKQEQQLVREYVESQLIAYGVREPRILSTSSKLGLMHKSDGAEDVYEFWKVEQEIFRFIREELYELSVKEVYYGLEHFYKQVKTYLETINAAEQNRTQTISHWEKRHADLVESSKQFVNELGFQGIERQLKEYMYYVTKRINDRFSELFLESFNPTVLKKGKAEEISQAYRIFVDVVKNALHKDLQVTIYRFEQYMLSSVSIITETVAEREQVQFPSFKSHLQFEWPSSSMDFFHGEEKDVQVILKKMRNTKWLFEQNGKKEVMEELRHLVLEKVEHHVTQETTYFSEQGQIQFMRLSQEVKVFMEVEIEKYVAQVLSFLDATDEKEKLIEIAEFVQKIQRNSLS